MANSECEPQSVNTNENIGKHEHVMTQYWLT